MAKTIQITTGFLGEEYTLKSALNHHMKANELILKEYKNKFVPNQHLIIADIKNSKSLLKKLNI